MLWLLISGLLPEMFDYEADLLVHKEDGFLDVRDLTLHAGDFVIDYAQLLFEEFIVGAFFVGACVNLGILGAIFDCSILFLENDKLRCLISKFFLDALTERGHLLCNVIKLSSDFLLDFFKLRFAILLDLS